MRWLGFASENLKNKQQQQEKMLAEASGQSLSHVKTCIHVVMEQVKVLGLLDGLVDPATGEMLKDEAPTAWTDLVSSFNRICVRTISIIYILANVEFCECN